MGLRDWVLVLKHKEANKKLISGFEELLVDNFKLNEYLFVHIRRGDFLDVNEFKDLNYGDQVLIKV